MHRILSKFPNYNPLRPELRDQSINGLAATIRCSLHDVTGLGLDMDMDRAKTLHESPTARRKETLILTIDCLAHRSPMLSSFPNLFDALTHPNLRVLQAHYKVAARGVESLVDTVNLFHGMPKMTDEQRAEYIALIPTL
ncbi:hypothetical protein K503DRAFT_774594 [Rhizopogon vinicolor AM-OR11-026]|uniref:Uncharacterized protein n=1 Tax=Rhizopogon vinicolor AM-OR11-026 TaxID=1314800 RepID=A0A1B7MP85_9AGAM|nr:hypothetical protein K503DRAFT_774594 [Rhizopogon vinicolor AM-OR11-026]